MLTGRELELVGKMDAADYVGFMRESRGVASEWLLPYYRFVCYSRGMGVPRDLTAARAELLPVLSKIMAAAEAGDGVAENTMGILLELGYPTETGRVPPNAVLAREWYRKSAESGYAKGQANYARFCWKGIGGPKSRTENLKWCRAAADQGDAKSQYLLAFFLVQQKGEPRDVAQIAGLVKASAENGGSVARRIIGMCEDDLSDARVYAELLIFIAEEDLRQRQATGGLAFSINVPTDWDEEPDEEWLLANQPKGSQMPPTADARKMAIPDLNRANASFSALLIRYVRDRFEGDAPRVYRAARINRKTYSAIISDELRAVSKRTAVAFALALKLTRTEADEFLRSAGFAFSPSIREDIVFSACLDAGICDLARVNRILVAHQSRPFLEAEE